jgi:hypothetical protein
VVFSQFTAAASIAAVRGNPVLLRAHEDHPQSYKTFHDIGVLIHSAPLLATSHG